MGTMVQGARGAPKSAHSVTTQAAGTPSVTAGNAAIFVGANIAHRQAEAFRHIEECRNALIEQGFPDTAAYTTAEEKVGVGKASLVVTQGAAIGTLTEDSIAVIYTAGFTPARASTHELSDMVVLLRETWLESRKAA